MHLRRLKHLFSLGTSIEEDLPPSNPPGSDTPEPELVNIVRVEPQVTSTTEPNIEGPDCNIDIAVIQRMDDYPMNSIHSTADPQKSQKSEIGDGKMYPTAPSFIVGTVTVKAEELGLVLVVLFLWAGAITLFINRWGKLRMLEPYQPAYTAPDPPSPPRQGPQPPFINIHSTSNPSLNDILYQSLSPTGSLTGCYPDIGNYLDTIGMDVRRERRASQQLIPHNVRRERRASQQATSAHTIGMGHSPSNLNIKGLNSSRRVRSAVDLVSLVMQEKMSPSSTNQFLATNV